MKKTGRITGSRTVSRRWVFACLEGRSSGRSFTASSSAGGGDATDVSQVFHLGSVSVTMSSQGNDMSVYMVVLCKASATTISAIKRYVSPIPLLLLPSCALLCQGGRMVADEVLHGFRFQGRAGASRPVSSPGFKSRCWNLDTKSGLIEQTSPESKGPITRAGKPLDWFGLYGSMVWGCRENSRTRWTSTSRAPSFCPVQEDRE